MVLVQGDIHQVDEAAGAVGIPHPPEFQTGGLFRGLDRVFILVPLGVGTPEDGHTVSIPPDLHVIAVVADVKVPGAVSQAQGVEGPGTGVEILVDFQVDAVVQLNLGRSRRGRGVGFGAGHDTPARLAVPAGNPDVGKFIIAQGDGIVVFKAAVDHQVSAVDGNVGGLGLGVGLGAGVDAVGQIGKFIEPLGQTGMDFGQGLGGLGHHVPALHTANGDDVLGAGNHGVAQVNPGKFVGSKVVHTEGNFPGQDLEFRG